MGADHPRSRGVYAHENARNHALLGSSPLARGLRPPAVCGPRHTRIIPARAGFTSRSRVAGPRSWDHPRSRGVYASVKCTPPPGSGSSPLARGLRIIQVPQEYFGRIIPARAGFTYLPAEVDALLSDHPRSRGVYPRAPTTMLKTPGSSPLARGLHYPNARIIVIPGIIPARAGFTSQDERVSMINADHPRSRGVYKARTREPVYTAGSSPLARGLRFYSVHSSAERWIIPARAGFTRHP